MRPIVAMCPGQGSQVVGMADAYQGRSPEIRAAFEEASEVLGTDLRSAAGDPDQLRHTEITQPAILAFGVGMYRAFVTQTGVAPQALAGHSLGEYTALVCGNALDFADAIRIIGRRGELMGRAGRERPSGMVSVHGVTRADVEQALTRWPHLALACDNSPVEFVVAGDNGALDDFLDAASRRSWRTTRLCVAGGFHSPAMQSVVNDFRAVFETVTFRTPTCDVYCNVTASPYQAADEIPGELARQITQPVRWRETIERLTARPSLLVDLGPSQTLSKMVRNSWGFAGTVPLHTGEASLADALVHFPELLSGARGRMANWALRQVAATPVGATAVVAEVDACTRTVTSLVERYECSKAHESKLVDAVDALLVAKRISEVERHRRLDQAPRLVER